MKKTHNDFNIFEIKALYFKNFNRSTVPLFS